MNKEWPQNYSYHIIKHEHNKELIFRIKGIFCEDKALMWVREFGQCTKTVWRKSRTYRTKPGKRNVFKVDMRCARATDRRVKGLKPSKQTGCNATLRIIIKKSNDIAACVNKIDQKWPTIVILKGTHNHEVNTVDTLSLASLDERISLLKCGPQSTTDDSKNRFFIIEVTQDHFPDREPATSVAVYKADPCSSVWMTQG